VIKTAPLTESRVVSTIHQPSVLYSHSKVLSSQDEDQEQNSDMKTMMRPIELALDEGDNDYSSEAESLNSDSSTVDDHKQEVDSEFGIILRRIKFLIRNLLKGHDPDSILLEIQDSSRTFTCCPAEGSTSTRRQGSPIGGSPPKRRSIGQGKMLQLPEDDGQGDNEEDPDDRRGKNEVKQRVPSRSDRPFACHFYQREPHRYNTNRACRGSAWYGYSRVK
jgi:hypothetical protein